MSPNISAGLLMCRWFDHELQFFLVHPGGPFFKNRDAGVWSIPKGLPETGEDLLTAAQREFNEETGLHPAPPYYPLDPIRQKSGKVVHAWAFIGEWDEARGITCNSFEMEWPPKSGQLRKFPEQDRAAWMNLQEAHVRINPAQVQLLEKAASIFRRR